MQNRPVTSYDGFRIKLDAAKDPSRQLWKIIVPSEKHRDQILDLLRPEFRERCTCEDTEEAERATNYSLYSHLGPLFNPGTDVRKFRRRVEYKAAEVWTSNSKDGDDVKSSIVFYHPDESYEATKSDTDMYMVESWDRTSTKARSWIRNELGPWIEFSESQLPQGDGNHASPLAIAFTGLASGSEGEQHAQDLVERLKMESGARRPITFLTFNSDAAKVFELAKFEASPTITLQRPDNGSSTITALSFTPPSGTTTA